jgi:hypothetical protein
MTGSNAVYIAMPIVAILALGFWLIMMFHSDSHPTWQGQPPPRTWQSIEQGAPQAAVPAPEGAVPAPRAESARGSTGPAVSVPPQGGAAEGATPQRSSASRGQTPEPPA